MDSCTNERNAMNPILRPVLALLLVLPIAPTFAEDATAPAPADASKAPADATKPDAAKPADPVAAEPPKPKPQWVDATNDLANNKWGPGGVTLLAVVPGTDQIIAGVSEKWLWTSANGGTSWAELGTVGNAKNRPSSILFDPKAPDAFWVTSSAGAPGAFATTDGGKTFKPVPNIEAADSISIDFTDPKHKTVIVGPHEKEHDVEVSTNGGTFFSKASKFPNTTGYTGQVLVLDDKTWLASAAGFDKKQKKEKEVGIWRTDDAGKTWTKVYNNGGTAPAFVASNGALYWELGENEGLLRSNNRGKSWNSLGAAVKHSPMELPKRWLAAIGDQQLVISTDGGDSWDAVGEKLTFQPAGAVFCEKRHCFFAWQSTSAYQKEAVMRLDVPENLDELVNPTVARDLVAWDGDDKKIINCWFNKEIATFGAQSSVAHQGSTALLWHVAAKTFFSNCGAFWCTYPVKATDGLDASSEANLVFSFKMDGASKPTSLRPYLCSIGEGGIKVVGKQVELLTYCPKAFDGQWHDVVIPLAAFAAEKFTLKQLCELSFDANNKANEFAFDMYVDSIGFSK